MKFISLFAGIGGFDLALTRQGHECVYANEWDKYAAQIYDQKFKTKIDRRDIRTVPEDSIPDHDLLVGGFPCQSFSIAGKRQGFNETRGTLFFEIARILDKKRPRLFILENVKGLLSHDEGRTFRTIITTLDELGYDLQWQVLNSKNFGVPQNRERVFIVGNLRGESRPKVFPIGGTGEIRHKRVSDKETICQTLKARYPGDWNGNYLKEITQRVSQGYRVYDPSGISTTLAGEAGGMGAKTGLYATPRIRKLTPTECERLQGFPDGWTIGVSDNQRYKCLGNAVTVNVVEAIAKRL